MLQKRVNINTYLYKIRPHEIFPNLRVPPDFSKIRKRQEISKR
jgi:hypothetical protein